MDAVMEMLVAIASSAGDQLFTDEEMRRIRAAVAMYNRGEDVGI